MGSLSEQHKRLYRSVWRCFARLPFSRPVRLNLARLYRPQLRQVFASPPDDLEQRGAPALSRLPYFLLTSWWPTVSATLRLLRNNPGLVKNLSSLSYHHYPHHIPHTSNAHRLAPLQGPRIAWNPQDPEASLKAAKAHKKREKKDAQLIQMAHEVTATLQRTMKNVEREEGVFMGELAPEKRPPRWSDL